MKRAPRTTIELKNNDRFLAELISARIDNRPTTYLIRVNALTRGKKTTTLTLVTTKN